MAGGTVSASFTMLFRKTLTNRPSLLYFMVSVYTMNNRTVKAECKYKTLLAHLPTRMLS